MIFLLFSHYFLPAPEDFAGISSWDLSLCQLRSKKGNFCNQLHAGHCCTSIYRPEDIDHDDHDEHEDDDDENETSENVPFYSRIETLLLPELCVT